MFDFWFQILTMHMYFYVLLTYIYIYMCVYLFVISKVWNQKSIHSYGNGNERQEILFLEIWTNGSLTPKEALALGLAFVFPGMAFRFRD